MSLKRDDRDIRDNWDKFKVNYAEAVLKSGS
jgi:hypothetical protein